MDRYDGVDTTLEELAPVHALDLESRVVVELKGFAEVLRFEVSWQP